MSKILIISDDKGLRSVHFSKDIKKDLALIAILNPDAKVVKDKVKNKKVETQLKKYFAGKLKSFNTTLFIFGTDFQKRVWKELLKIPYGKTCTYGEIAKKIGKPKASRAVGAACNRNPIGIIIPCHRVLGTKGALTGYAGGINLKKKLLSLEGTK